MAVVCVAGCRPSVSGFRWGGNTHTCVAPSWRTIPVKIFATRRLCARVPAHAQCSCQREIPLPASTRGQSRGLAPLRRGGLRPRLARQQRRQVSTPPSQSRRVCPAKRPPAAGDRGPCGGSRTSSSNCCRLLGRSCFSGAGTCPQYPRKSTPANGVFGTTSTWRTPLPLKPSQAIAASPLKIFSPQGRTAELGLAMLLVA